MTRHFWVVIHRYTGLAMAALLILAALSGSILAFSPELNHLFAPHLFPAPKACAPLGEAALAEAAEKLAPGAKVVAVYRGEPGTAYVTLVPGGPSGGGASGVPGFDQLFLDPCTSSELGRRYSRALSADPASFVPFLFRLHHSLAIPEWGGLILGWVAILWTIDCFVSFFLTLPRTVSVRAAPFVPTGAGRKSWWSRWKTSWSIKFNASGYRLVFDLHRAGGLWLWTMLFVFAWSSVMLNMQGSVYVPVMKALSFEFPERAALHGVNRHISTPIPDWRQAQTTAERLAAEEGRRHGFTVEHPILLRFQPAQGVYYYNVRSSLDIQNRLGRTRFYFDADSGELLLTELPTGYMSGYTATTWLAMLHKGHIGGLPYRIFVCAFGVFITILTVTGVLIWLKKIRSRRSKAVKVFPQI